MYIPPCVLCRSILSHASPTKETLKTLGALRSINRAWRTEVDTHSQRIYTTYYKNTYTDLYMAINVRRGIPIETVLSFLKVEGLVHLIDACINGTHITASTTLSILRLRPQDHEPHPKALLATLEYMCRLYSYMAREHVLYCLGRSPLVATGEPTPPRRPRRYPAFLLALVAFYNMYSWEVHVLGAAGTIDLQELRRFINSKIEETTSALVETVMGKPFSTTLARHVHAFMNSATTQRFLPPGGKPAPSSLGALHLA